MKPLALAHLHSPLPFVGVSFVFLQINILFLHVSLVYNPLSLSLSKQLFSFLSRQSNRPWPMDTPDQGFKMRPFRPGAPFPARISTSPNRKNPKFRCEVRFTRVRPRRPLRNG
uniref:Uncharacterized protein n=1 Tax=Opuntia streptacantha TaxID=393608 RepID=A0A7C8ZXW0_OPUST